MEHQFCRCFKWWQSISVLFLDVYAAHFNLTCLEMFTGNCHIFQKIESRFLSVVLRFSLTGMELKWISCSNEVQYVFTHWIRIALNTKNTMEICTDEYSTANFRGLFYCNSSPSLPSLGDTGPFYVQELPVGREHLQRTPLSVLSSKYFLIADIFYGTYSEACSFSRPSRGWIKCLLKNVQLAWQVFILAHLGLLLFLYAF